jgi:putative ABC transport system permease protein
VVIGILTGVLAAVFPARMAVRQDPVKVLSGRRGTVRTPRRAPILGVLVVCAGVAASAIGSAIALADATGATPGSGLGARSLAALIAGGAVLTQLGLIACSSAIIGVCGRWARRLPLVPRLAMRDAARHRGRSAPAMAAVLTAVAAATALVLYISAVDDRDRRNYTPMWPKGTAGLNLFTLEDQGPGKPPAELTLDPDEILARVAPELPPATATVVHAEASGRCADACTRADLIPVRSGGRSEGAGFSMGWGGVPVGGVETLRATTGTSSAAAETMLKAGGVVVTDPALVAGGRVELEVVSEAEQRRSEASGGVPGGRRVSVPGVYLAAPDATTNAVYSRAAAERLGLDVAPALLALRFDGRLPTTDEEDAARGALADAGFSTSFSVERGYVSDFGVGLLALALGAALITLGAAGISTGLAQADARDDHATLAAIGAAPRVRKTLAAAQSVAIAGLGTVLGVLAGFVPAVSLIGGAPSLELVVPWDLLAGAIVGTPLLAAGAAWLLTRARLPLRARVA